MTSVFVGLFATFRWLLIGLEIENRRVEDGGTTISVLVFSIA